MQSLIYFSRPQPFSPSLSRGRGCWLRRALLQAAAEVLLRAGAPPAAAADGAAAAAAPAAAAAAAVHAAGAAAEGGDAAAAAAAAAAGHGALRVSRHLNLLSKWPSVILCFSADNKPYFRYMMGGTQAEQAGLHLSMGSLLDAEQQRAAAMQGAMVRKIDNHLNKAHNLLLFISSLFSRKINSRVSETASLPRIHFPLLPEAEQ